MFTTPFKNYDEFKELFVRVKDNGETARKNGVLLTFLKSRSMRPYLERYGYSAKDFNSMAALYTIMKDIVYQASWNSYSSCDGDSSCNKGWSREKLGYIVKIMGRDYVSDTYETDGKDGICVDGDLAGYRYVNKEREGRVFKMKIGKMYRHLIDLTTLRDDLPESVKLYLCEEMTREWEAYTSSRINCDYVLHVDDDFKAIYDGTARCEGHFNSCMQDRWEEHWKFYRDSVKAKAAYLTIGDDPNATIVARCILFTEVTREDTGEVIRVAERQYSTDGDELKQRILIAKLIEGRYIDAYKKTGAGCGDASSFVDLAGNSLRDVKLHIECTVDFGEPMAYQDSFKWYDKTNGVAYNYYNHVYEYDLASTDNYFEEEEKEYDEYHDRYVESTIEVYYQGGWIQCDEEDIDDFRYIEYGRFDGDYVHEDECEYCEDIDAYVHENDAHFSEILNAFYYDEEDMWSAEEEYKRDNWYYAEVDDEEYGDEAYFEDEDEVTKIAWSVDFMGDYTFRSISVWRADYLVRWGKAVIIDGKYFLKDALGEMLDFEMELA